MNNLPQDLEDIIFDYKDQLEFSEHEEKYSRCMEELHSRSFVWYNCHLHRFDFRKYGQELLIEVDTTCGECDDEWLLQDMAEEAFAHYGGDYDTRYEDPEHPEYNPFYGSWI